MSRKVTYARLHQRLHSGSVGDIGDVLPSPNKTLDRLTMTIGAQGLSVLFSFKGVSKELLIPSANVAFMELAPEEPTTKAVKSA